MIRKPWREACADHSGRNVRQEARGRIGGCQDRMDSHGIKATSGRNPAAIVYLKAGLKRHVRDFKWFCKQNEIVAVLVQVIADEEWIEVDGKPLCLHGDKPFLEAWQVMGSSEAIQRLSERDCVHHEANHDFNAHYVVACPLPGFNRKLAPSKGMSQERREYNQALAKVDKETARALRGPASFWARAVAWFAKENDRQVFAEIYPALCDAFGEKETRQAVRQVFPRGNPLTICKDEALAIVNRLD